MRKFMTRKEVRDRVKYSFTQIQRLEDAGLFPERIRLGNGPRCKVVWLEEDVDAWLDERIAASRKPTD